MGIFQGSRLTLKEAAVYKYIRIHIIIIIIQQGADGELNEKKKSEK